MVIWLIGLSGSGKTTIGRRLYQLWKQRAPNVVLIDGDEIREVFGLDRGSDAYTIAGRRLNAERIAALCAMLDRQDIHVVCCILSIFDDIRQDNRRRYSKYFEVFVDAPLEVLERRDPKGHYAAARSGRMNNVVGIDIPFDRPRSSDLVIDNARDLSDPSSLAAEIFERAVVPHG